MTMTEPGIIHLVVGSTGAGKTTFCRRLAEREGLVRFAIDEWMEGLFFPDRPEDAPPDWYLDRIQRATDRIWDTVTQLLPLGTSVVLEIGLTQRAAREAFYEHVVRAGFDLRLSVLDAPADVRWQRIDERNQKRGPTHVMDVSRGMFDFVEAMWEPPDDAELSRWSGEVVDTGQGS
jgi:predicted kinase